jgi:hypothetical protein
MQAAAAGVSVLYYKPITALSLLDTYHNMLQHSLGPHSASKEPLPNRCRRLLNSGHTTEAPCSYIHISQRRVLHFDFPATPGAEPTDAYFTYFIFGPFKILSALECPCSSSRSREIIRKKYYMGLWVLTAAASWKWCNKAKDKNARALTRYTRIVQPPAERCRFCCWCCVWCAPKISFRVNEIIGKKLTARDC